jgi:ribosome-associated protein
MSEEYEYHEDDVEFYAVRPNKTQLKKDIAVLFALGEEMSELSVTQLKTLELPEKIYKAVAEVAGMPLKGARKRSLKFIAGQLHKIDVKPIQEKLARIKNQSAHAVREHHIVERWRDRLIKEGNDALTELLGEHSDADRQQLRQLVRNAQKETETAKPPKSSRLLYHYLKDLFKGENRPESEEEQNIEPDDHEKDNHPEIMTDIFSR